MITVFTPTYNRAHTLPRLYSSLCAQTEADFEWLVVDDGSTDDTPALFDKWTGENSPFPIRYVRQENGGKHRAINRGVPLAKGEYFFIVDSDDYLTDDAVASVHVWIAGIAGLDGFAGVAGLKSDESGAVSGGTPDFGGCEYRDATNLERNNFSLGGEKAEVYRTDILRRFPFPAFDGENFITEAVVWDAVAQAGYRLRWFGHVIYHFEYRTDGLTQDARSEQSKARQRLNNPMGYEYRVKQQLALGDKRNRISAIQGWSKMASMRGDAWREISSFLHTPIFIIWAIQLAFWLRGKLRRA